MPGLPIEPLLPEIRAALAHAANLVLVAPPGAGKTSAVAPALLGEPWCTGEILLLSPRRLAARAAAERMAENDGEPVGRTFGYATRMDSKASAATRVRVVTQGIFVNRIQDDPELAGVSAVLFDEVHERSLDGDFALALALDAQAGLRPDLRLVAMSATLDGARFSRLMQDAAVIESEGRSHPLTVRHVGRAAEARIEDGMARTIRRALAEQAGGLLAFLPGVAEIERTAERLEGLGDAIALHKLHGGADPAAQRAAIRPEPDGRRKLVLATAIAESSLTLADVRIVVDSGLARRPRYDRAAGMTRLVTERVSRAAATQRAGRAARQSPGVAYRLWEEGATTGLPPFDPPEIAEADLSGLVLATAIWGVDDPRKLAWLDPPAEAAVAEARSRLQRLGAIDDAGRPTAHGRALAALPLAPRIAHMLVRGGELGFAPLAAEVAVLLSERGLGGSDPDLEQRLRRWRVERGQRAQAAQGLAKRWASLAPRGRQGAVAPSVGAALALAFPDRVARPRDTSGEAWASVGGRGYRIDATSALARAPWLAIGDAQGSASAPRILSAAAIDLPTIEALFADRIERRTTLAFDPASGTVRATDERRLGALRLSGGQDARADPEAIAAALVAGVRDHGLALLPWNEDAQALRARIAFAARHDATIPPVDDAALQARTDEWLPPLVEGKRRLGALSSPALLQAIEALVGWPAMRRVDTIAPPRLATPAGSSHAIDYAAEGGPTLTCRPQALFGLAAHPHVAEGRVPLILSLTSPAGRPIQTTRDLPGFWSGSWAAVAKEMRGRYPRHPWPDDPANATPTLRTKNADARARGSR